MAERSSDQIPQDLREAFLDAVTRYSEWGRGGQEPLVNFRQGAETISSVSKMVMNFKDPMPDDVHDKLGSLMRSTDEFVRDHSYANGARSFLKLIDARKAEYQWR